MPYSKKQSKKLKQVSYHFEFDYEIWVKLNKRGNKSILLPSGQQQLIAILPNIQILTTVNQEEE